MNKLFNTPFETGLRALLILYGVKNNGMTIDRIAAYDFICIYGSDFEVSQKNLHGDNSFNFSELSAKRTICSEGVKAFVLDGLITVKRTQGGFLYALTAAGREYVDSLESDYKQQYLEIVKAVDVKYSGKSDSALLKEINGKAVQSLRR